MAKCSSFKKNVVTLHSVRKQAYDMKICPHLFLLFLLLTAGCINEHDTEQGPDPIGIGDSLPALTVSMSNGITVSEQTLKARPSVILFFNTSCSECQAELPVIQSLYETYGTDGRAAFVAISREQDENSISSYWAENGLTLPFSAQTDRSIYQLFAYATIPRIYIADSDGIVRAIFTDSPLATADDLIRELEKLL